MTAGNRELEGREDWGELNPLARYLEGDDAPPFPHSVSEADGLLAAIAVGPEPIPEAEWVELLFDGEPVFANEAEAAAVLDCLRKRLAEIIGQLSGDDFSYRPMLLAEDDLAISSDWPNGFMAAYALRADAWDPLVKHPKSGIFMLPILSVAYTDDNEPLLDLTVEEQDEAMENAPASLPLCVHAIHDFFRARQNRRALQPTVKPPKAGRNDPCPCGSGKKYKKCCL
jgi:uncharacterized protein